MQATEGNKDVLGHLLYTAKVVAVQEGLADGFRVVINDGADGCKLSRRTIGSFLEKQIVCHVNSSKIVVQYWMP